MVNNLQLKILHLLIELEQFYWLIQTNMLQMHVIKHLMLWIMLIFLEEKLLIQGLAMILKDKDNLHQL